MVSRSGPPPVRRFVLSGVISAIGDGATTAILAVAVLMSGYSPATAGVLLAAGTIPKCVLLVWGGVAGDRYDQRALIVGSYLTAAAAQIVTAATMAAHGPVAVLAAAQVVFGCTIAFGRPAATAYLTAIVPPDDLTRANALLTAGLSASSTIGPLVATVFVAIDRPALALALDGLSFMVAAALLIGLPQPPTPLGRKDPGLAAIREGVRHLRRIPWLAWEMWVSAFLLLFATGPFLVLGPSAVSRIGGPQLWTVSLVAFGIGQISGSMLAGRMGPGRATLSQSAVALTVLALPPCALLVRAPATAFVVAELLTGVALGLYQVSVVTAMQQAVPRAVLARVASLNALVSFSTLPLSFLLAPLAAELVGLEQTLAGSAVAAGLAGAALLASPYVRRYRSPAAIASPSATSSERKVENT